MSTAAPIIVYDITYKYRPQGVRKMQYQVFLLKKYLPVDVWSYPLDMLYKIVCKLHDKIMLNHVRLC